MLKISLRSYICIYSSIVYHVAILQRQLMRHTYDAMVQKLCVPMYATYLCYYYYLHIKITSLVSTINMILCTNVVFKEF